jgi:hypothetical protein
MKPISKLLLLFSISSFPLFAAPKSIETNEITISNPPSWLTKSMVTKVIGDIEKRLEWDLRKASAKFTSDEAEFKSHHNLGGGVLAYSRKSESKIEMGPSVTAQNFTPVFGHEIAHLIIGQKYQKNAGKNASVPAWLEEGLANWAARNTKIDYKWLNSQPIKPVTSLIHPFENVGGAQASSSTQYHYQASSALAEMLDKKCDLSDLLQLALKRGIDKYLATACEIDDIDKAFRAWIKKKG